MTDFRLLDTTEERRFHVTGAPELAAAVGDVRIRPDLAIATFVDRQFTGARVSGFVMRRDDSPGEATREIYVSGSGLVPEWLAPITDPNFRGA
jgi:hypothetical protein